MRYFILVVLCAMFVIVGCRDKEGNWLNKVKSELPTIIQAKYKCVNLKWLYIGKSPYGNVGAAYVSVNACGVVRTFSYAERCEDCSFSWREVKQTKEPKK
jgi:hypothetical protein